MYLREETIKYHCSQTFLQKPYKVRRNEFIAFDKYVNASKEEIMVCFFVLMFFELMLFVKVE